MNEPIHRVGRFGPPRQAFVFCREDVPKLDQGCTKVVGSIRVLDTMVQVDFDFTKALCLHSSHHSEQAVIVLFAGVEIRMSKRNTIRTLDSLAKGESFLCPQVDPVHLGIDVESFTVDCPRWFVVICNHDYQMANMVEPDAVEPAAIEHAEGAMERVPEKPWKRPGQSRDVSSVFSLILHYNDSSC